MTVVQALRERLPGESIVYFGDTARVPYGSKSTETIRRYTREIVRFLKRHDIKMLAVACNSCSAAALDCVAAEFDGPVLGVIEPGAAAAARKSRTGRIGVIGTQATIGSRAYEKAVLERLPNAEVSGKACPLFVPLAEERMEAHPAAELIAREYLAPLLERGIDTLILGCTHYPLLRKTIAAVVGPSVALVDSAESTAEAAEILLGEHDLDRDAGAEAALRFYVSDDPGSLERFFHRLRPRERAWVGLAQPTEASSTVRG